MITVAHVLAPAPFGGMESVVEHLCGALPAMDVAPVVFALGTDGIVHPWLEQLEAQGVRVARVGAPGGARLSEWRLVRDTARRLGVEALHSHGYRADLACLRAATATLPWISTVHGFTPISARASLYQVLDRLALRRAARVVAVSSAIAAELARWGVRPARIALLRNAVPRIRHLGPDEARASLGLPGGRPIVAWVGRFSAEKGPDRLVAVARAMPPDGVLALVGDGPLREQTISALAADAPAADVRWLGSRADVASLMRAFDILVLPSRTEGMPMVVLEAMAAGVPVAAFAVGDTPTVVSAETGWLVPPGRLDLLADAVRDALHDPALRHARGAAGQRAVDVAFSPDAWARAHADGYRAVLGRGGQGGR